MKYYLYCISIPGCGYYNVIGDPKLMLARHPDGGVVLTEACPELEKYRIY